MYTQPPATTLAQSIQLFQPPFPSLSSTEIQAVYRRGPGEARASGDEGSGQLSRDSVVSAPETCPVSPFKTTLRHLNSFTTKPFRCYR